MLDITTVSFPLWMIKKGIKNEKGVPLEFVKHKFLYDIACEKNPHIVVKKCAQIGCSVLTTLRAYWFAKYRKLSTIYTLPSDHDVYEFVPTKVDKIFQTNEEIRASLTKDSTGLKGIGDEAFIYFKGTRSKSAPISTTADILAHDEIDRSDYKIIGAYSSRTDYSEYKGRWLLSNPSIGNAGIDAEFRKSDQREWFVKCDACQQEQVLEWEKNIDFVRKIYVCQFCGAEITNKMRMKGRWKATASSSVSGYHISQLMASWLSVSELIDKKEKFGDEVFYNFVLGEPYDIGGATNFRTMIMDALTTKDINAGRVAIGIDIGRIKHYVAGTAKGIFEIGTVETRQEVINLIRKYDPIMIMDALPERTWAEELQKEFPNNITLNFFNPDKPQNEMMKWGGDTGSDEDIKNTGIVWSHRTRVIDKVISEFLNGNMQLKIPKDMLERYIAHWETMRRIVEIDKLNRPRFLWTSSSGNDHYCLATIYYYIALQRLSGDMDFIADEKETRPDIERREHGFYIRPLKEVMDELDE